MIFNHPRPDLTREAEPLDGRHYFVTAIGYAVAANSVVAFAAVVRYTWRVSQTVNGDCEMKTFFLTDRDEAVIQRQLEIFNGTVGKGDEDEPDEVPNSVMIEAAAQILFRLPVCQSVSDGLFRISQELKLKGE